MAETTLNPQIEEILKMLVTALQPQPVPQPETEADGYVLAEAVKTYKRFEDYPDTLRAKHVSAILDISIVKAYEVLNSEKCPSFTIGKSKRIDKELFIDYVRACQGQDLID